MKNLISEAQLRMMDRKNRSGAKLKITLCFFSILLLLPLLISNAHALPVQVLDITIDYYPSILYPLPPPLEFDMTEVTNSHLYYYIFESTRTDYPINEIYPIDKIATGTINLEPGINKFELALPVTNFTNLFISMQGGFDYVSGGHLMGADLPESIDRDAQMEWWIGPLWIPLKDIDLGLALSGDLVIFENGVGQLGGTWEVARAVPEPATMLLFGIGLVGLVGTRLRRKNLIVGT